MKSKIKKTELKILSAAAKIFHSKGYDGARMQEIANEAKINKSLLHYHFGSKELLFQKILKKDLFEILSKMTYILESDLSLQDKIYKFSVDYTDQLIKYPHIPSFIIHELNSNPNILVGLIKDDIKFTPKKFIEQIEHEIKSGNIYPVDPKEFVINLMSMVLFPFIAQPLITKMLEIDDYTSFMKKRAQGISKQLLCGVEK